MNASNLLDRVLSRYGKLAAPIYCTLVIGLCGTTAYALLDVLGRHQSYSASLEALARLEESTKASSNAKGNHIAWPPGSPFLEGKTVTVASAALLQRVTGAITAAGGSVVASEVEMGAQSKDGYLKVTATGELKQEALQQVLYDIESGMPFLFIDYLMVQTPPPSDEDGRLRVRIGASGLWPGAR